MKPIIDYQTVVSSFNKKAATYFSIKKIPYIDFEMWYLMFIRARQSQQVLEKELNEMANILYNSYIVFRNYEEKVDYYQKIQTLEKYLNYQTKDKHI